MVELPSGLIAEARFRNLAAVLAKVEWFANIDNPRTRRAYQSDIQDFTAFLGIRQPALRVYIVGHTDTRRQPGWPTQQIANWSHARVQLGIRRIFADAPALTPR